MLSGPFEGGVSNLTDNIERVPFEMEKKLLEGTSYTYQCGISATSEASDIVLVREAYPDIPFTGSDKSGILVFDGEEIIGSYIVPNGNVMHSALVKDEHQKQGLGTRMVEQFMREVPVVIDSTVQQAVNLAAAKTFFKAHANAVSWAVANNKDVPQEVVDAAASGEEAQKWLDDALTEWQATS